MTKTESLPTPSASEQSRPEKPQPKPREISPAVRSWIKNVIAPALAKTYQEEANKAKLPEGKVQAEEAESRYFVDIFRPEPGS